MEYPYEGNCATWIEGFPLAKIREHLRAHAEHELAHHKQWWESLSAKEQQARGMWRPRNEVIPASLQPSFQDIVGPYEIAVIEQMRLELGLDAHDVSAIPTDAFIWALGEPDVRYATKVGGLPFRPKDQPWPVIAPDQDPNPSWRKAAGEPMTFLAQFCFAGSRDLFPELPGDVLLIFAEDEQFSRPEAVYLEWQPLGLTSLVDADAVPAPSWKFVTAYGYRYRTLDFAPHEGDDESLGDAGRHVRVLGATKIGGRPHYLQTTTEAEGTRHSDTRLLAQLSSLIPATGHYYPWLNHREPWAATSGDDKHLNLVDDGKLYFSLQPDGQVAWGFEFH